MLNKIQQFAFEAEGLFLFLLIALNFVVAPVTYAFMVVSATDWTWYNVLPRVIGYAFASAGWAIYWPLMTIFG